MSLRSAILMTAGMLGLLSYCLFPVFSAQAEHPFTQLSRDPKQLKSLQKVLTAAARKAYGKPGQIPETLPGIFSKPQALFLTLKKADRTYGCMGALQAQGKNLLEEIQLVLPKALFQDPRHPAVGATDLPGMEVYLSAVGQPLRVDDVNRINPARDAILAKSGAKAGVVLPGEAKTLRYLLDFAKAKAGIGDQEAFQVYKVPTVTVMVKLPEDFKL